MKKTDIKAILGHNMALGTSGGFRSYVQGQLLPTALAFLLLLLQKAPLIGIGGVSPMPSLLIIAIFFWSITTEQRLNSAFIFALGLTEDLLTGAPLGLWAITFLLLHFYVISQRQVLNSSSFIANWLFFAVILLATYGFVHIMTGLLSGHYAELIPLILPYLTTLAIFPVMIRFLSIIEDRLALAGLGS